MGIQIELNTGRIAAFSLAHVCIGIKLGDDIPAVPKSIDQGAVLHALKLFQCVKR